MVIHSAFKQDRLSLFVIFFDSSKTHSTTASKLAFQAQTVEAVNVTFRQELLPKNINVAQSNPAYFFIGYN